MGKGKPKVEVTEYFMSQHFGICLGADALLQLIIKEKEAWAGEQFTLAPINISLPDLFGGLKKEGGVRGTVHYLPGNPDQLLPDPLAQKLGRANGADCPGYRGLASLFFYGSPGFYWGANTPYLPGVWAKVRRAPRGYGFDEGTIGGFNAEIVDGLEGGESTDQFGNHNDFGYIYQSVSPDRGRTALSAGLATNLRAVVIDNVRDAYNQREIIFADVLPGDETSVSQPWLDDAGNVYVSSDDGTKTWAIDPSDTVTQIGSTSDLPLNNGTTRIFTIIGLYDVSGTETLIYAPINPMQPTHQTIYTRTLPSGTPVAHDLGLATAFTRATVQDGDGNVWIPGLPYDGTAYPGALTSSVYFWCVAGPRNNDAEIVTGLPAINSVLLDSILTATYFDGRFFLNWNMQETGPDHKYTVVIDADDFTVIHSIDVYAVLGFTPATGVDVFPGTGAPMIDTANNHLLVNVDAYFFAPVSYARIDLDTYELETVTVDSWPPTADFANWSPTSPYAEANESVYPYAVMWSDALGGIIVTPEPNAPDDYPTDFGILYADPATQDCMIGADANPSCMIFECLTNTDWGMGSPVSGIAVASFAEAEATLLEEEFGLSMIWTRQASIQNFVQEILDHIQGVLFVDPATGLLTLKLIRADYDPETLPVLNPDNSDLANFGRKLWGDIVNEITVTWTNPENEQEETVTAQDDASMAIQGGPVADSRNYYGVRNAALAQRLAWRDLRSAGQPLASCEAEVDRSQWDLRPASVVKLTWPEYGLSEIVMRVTSIDYGKPGDPAIRLTLVEDVYGLDIGTYEDPPGSEWEDTSSQPDPMAPVEIFTLPLFAAAASAAAEFIDTPVYPEVVAGILATTSNADVFVYELWDEVALPNGTLEWQSLATLNVIGRGELVGALAQEASSSGVALENIIGNTSPAVGGFFMIGSAGETGNEIAMMEAVAVDSTYTITRGVLDTVPRAWPAGTPVWFIDTSTIYEDPEVRSGGETVSYKLRSRTSQGLLPLANAPLESYTLSDRPWLPNRPADVKAFGEAWSSEAEPIDATARPDPWVTVTWANRNRLLEDTQVLAWTDATVTPETGQTTTIEVRTVGDVLMTTHAGLSGTSFDVPDASFGSETFVRLRVYSERTDDDGDFVSLQFFEHWVQLAPGGFLLLSGDASDGDDHELLSGDESGRIILSGVY